MTLGDKGYPSTSHKKRLCDRTGISSSLNYPASRFFHFAAAKMCPFTLSCFLCFSGRVALLSRGNSWGIAFSQTVPVPGDRLIRRSTMTGTDAPEPIRASLLNILRRPHWQLYRITTDAPEPIRASLLCSLTFALLLLNVK